MSPRVICSQCGQPMILQFVKVGEQFACKQCGTIGVVPESAEVSELQSTAIPHGELAAPTSSASTTSVSSSNPRPAVPAGIRVFSIIAATANGVFLFFTIIGMFTGEGEYDFATKVVFLIIFALSLANITVFAGRLQYLRKALISFNLVLFCGLPLLWLLVSKDPNVRIGSVMLLIVGVTSAIALTVCHKESWLSLRIERSRLEEMKRVADLRRELQLPDQQAEGNP